MQLTFYSDYSLRVLLYLSHMPKTTTTILEIANFYQISKNHLVKVVNHLAQHGLIRTIQGKGGGIQLKPSCYDLTLAEILIKTEPNFELVECFNKEKNHCRISKDCDLKKIFKQALKAFLGVLDNYTLADVSKPILTQQITHFLNSKKFIL